MFVRLGRVGSFDGMREDMGMIDVVVLRVGRQWALVA